ncbi:hydrolase [Aneurinibacillus terranovensis]|uniref:hydrolase n=1 Tax=Aneurinibacillus terranovensis TaxID=278991 RepID=UPI000412F9D8|nr:hydrolase [Aneurinibacillus terranovensis]
MQTLQITPEKTALVVIDLQKGIVGLKGAPYDGPAVVRNTVKMVDAFREAGGFVVFVRVDFHGHDALRPITDNPAPAVERPSGWSELVPELNPQATDYIVTKRQWGAFYGTDLDLQLRRRGIDTIVLCGIATNIGVDTTAREAYQRNYQQIFAIDAMTALSEEAHEFTRTNVFPRIGRVRTSDEIIAALAK